MKGKHAKNKQDSEKEIKTKKQMQIKSTKNSLKNSKSNTNKKIKASSSWKKREAASISDIRNYAMSKTKQRKRKRRIEQTLLGIATFCVLSVILYVCLVYVI